MEGNFRSETPPPSVAIGCSSEFNRSNSDASTLTAENCEDISHPSANVKPDDHTTWTEEKHNSYLEHLEVSFVNQLHQSMRLPAQCSEPNEMDGNISHVGPTNTHNAPEKLTVLRYGCGEKINRKRGDPLSHVSADSCVPPWVYRSESIGKRGPPASVDTPEFSLCCATENHGKVIASHGLESCSQKISSSSRYPSDLYNLTREGTGQNFVDEDNQDESNTESPRVKTLETTF